VSATGIRTTPGHIHALPTAVQHAIAHAVGNSLHDVFMLAAPIAFIGCLIVLTLREQPLRGRAPVAPKKRQEEEPCQSSPLTPSEA
jgi:H+/gluconate symporter-like permease